MATLLNDDSLNHPVSQATALQATSEAGGCTILGPIEEKLNTMVSTCQGLVSHPGNTHPKKHPASHTRSTQHGVCYNMRVL